MDKILNDGFAALGITPDSKAAGRLKTYYEYLEERNRVMNLTAISGAEDVARLHFLDCAALLTVCDFADKKVIDVGTGAGFPGMVDRLSSEVQHLKIERQHGQTCVKCNHHKNTYKE